MKYRLIYDKESEEIINNKVLPLVEDLVIKAEVFDADEVKKFSSKDYLLFYISDEQLKSIFFPVIIEKAFTITVLPHPENKISCIAFGVSRQLINAVDHLKKKRLKALKKRMCFTVMIKLFLIRFLLGKILSQMAI